jgi:hypothetical protein
MSKVFKRPMFRKGGAVSEGIMSMANPRTNYQEGGISEELKQKYPGIGEGYQKFYDLYSDVAQQDMGQAKSDILSNLLIRGGLGLVSGEGAGKGTLGAIGTAFRGPTEQAMGELQKLKGSEQAIKSAALGSAIESDLATQKIEADLQKAAMAKSYESGSFAAKVKEVQDILGEGALTASGKQQAVAIATKDVLAKDTPGIQYQGIMQMDSSGKQPDVDYLQTQPDGSVHLNPYTRQFYVKKSDPIRLELVDQGTLKEIQED